MNKRDAQPSTRCLSEGNFKEKIRNKDKMRKNKPNHQISVLDDLENSAVLSRPNETQLCKRMELLLIFKIIDSLCD